MMEKIKRCARLTVICTAVVFALFCVMDLLKLHTLDLVGSTQSSLMFMVVDFAANMLVDQLSHRPPRKPR